MSRNILSEYNLWDTVALPYSLFLDIHYFKLVLTDKGNKIALLLEP
jgi:hypothetical protein